MAPAACDLIQTLDDALALAGVDPLTARQLNGLVRQALAIRQAGGRRRDRLAELIEKTAEALAAAGREVDAEAVVLNLWRYDAGDEFNAVIQEISGDDGLIYWIDARGREQVTPFSAVGQRLRRLRLRRAA